MASKNFNVNILINVLLQGVEGATRLLTGGLQPAIDNVGKATKKATQDTERFIATVNDLDKRLKELQNIPRNSRNEEQAKELKLLTAAYTELFNVQKFGGNELKILKDLQAKLVSEGITGYKSLERSAQNLSNSLKALEDIKIGGTESIRKLQDILQKLQKGSDIKLDIDSATAIEETKKVEQNLRKLLDEAAKGGDIEGFKNTANILASITNTRKELERLLAERNKLDAKPVDIRVRIKEETPKVREELKNFKKEFELSKSIGLGVEFRSSGATDRLNALIKQVNSLKKDAKSIGQDTIEFDVQLKDLITLKKELTTVGARKDKIARNEITVKVGNLNQLKDLDKQARQLLIDLDAAKKAGNLKLVVSLQSDQAKIQAQLSALKKPIDELAQSSKKISLVESFEGVQAKLNAATISVQNYGQAEADAAQKTIQNNTKISESIIDIIKRTRQLATEVQKDTKTGNVERKPEFTSRANALQAEAQTLESSSDLSSKQFNALTKAKAKIEETTVSVNNLSAANVAAGNATQDNLAKLANNFANIKTQFKDTQAELKKAKELGNSVDIKPKIELDIDKVIAELKSALLEAQRLGQNDIHIRAVLDNAEKFKANLSSISQAQDDIARKKFVLKGEIDSSLTNVSRKLAELNRELDEAIKKGDVRVIVSVQSKIDSVRGELAALEPQIRSFQDKNKIQLFTDKSLDLNRAQQRLNQFSSSSQGSLKSLGNAFRLAAQDAGGARGAITGLASTFRLIGTSAFLAGGQLRTLGFGFSALANIVQNIGPVVFQFAAGLAKAGPPGLVILGVLTSIGVAASLVAIKLTVLTGALGALVQTGFEYNSALEQTKNASAALAQEFFNFSINGQKVNDTVEVGGRILTKYQVAQLAVEQQFQGLQSAALTTIFTNRELLSTFQNIILASKGLSPSLEGVTALTGQFARVAGLIGISAEKLASQVNLVLSGAGRVTSPLQRFLNSAKDSKGIELTAKRIRQLRAAGGDILFAELTNAINKFDEALKVANRASFAGVISNFQDLFEQISQISTKAVFDNLRDGLANVVDRLTQKVKVLKDDGSLLTDASGNAVEDVKPAQSLLRIGEVASRIFSVINKDILAIVNFLVDKLDVIAKTLEDNYTNIVNIYETSKDLLISVSKIVSAFIRLVTLSSGTNDQLKSTVTILDAIVVVADIFAFNLNLAVIAVNSLVLVLATIPLLLSEALLKAAQLGDFLFNANNESEFTKKIREETEAIEGFVRARSKAVLESEKENKAIVGEIGDIFTGKRNKDRETKIIEGAKEDQTNRILKGFEERKAQVRTDEKNKKISPQKASDKIFKIIDEENAFRQKVTEDINLRKAGKPGIDFSGLEKKPKITSTGTGKGTADDANKGKQKSQKSELADRKALVDEVRKLGIQQEQNELKLVQDRLAQEKDLVDAALDQNIISQQAASKKILDIKNQEINNEITTRKNALALLDAERLDKERAFISEKNDIEQNATKTNEKPNVTQSKLDVLDLKQSTDLISNLRERTKLEGEIAALSQSRNSLTLDYFKSLQSVSKETVRQVDDLERSVIDAQDLNDETTLRFRLLDIVKGKIEEIVNIEKQVSGINDLLVGETDTKVISILNKQLELLGRKRLLIEQEISIRQRLTQLQSLDNLASDLKNKLSSEESDLGLKVARGLVSERDATVEATSERIKYKQALEQVISAQEQLLNAPVTTEEQRIDNAQRRENLNKLKQELKELKTVIDDRELIQASNSIKDNFVSLFDSIQDGTKSAAESFSDLGKSILGTFRNLISRRLTEELFGSLFPTPGQSEGNVTGVFGKLFDKLGLGTASQDQKRAEDLARSSNGALDPKQIDLLNSLNKKVVEGNIGVVNSIEELKNKIKSETEDFASALEALTAKVNAAGTKLGEKDPNSAKEDAKRAIGNRPNVNSTAADKALNSPELSGKGSSESIPVTIKGVEVDGSDRGVIKVKSDTDKTGIDDLSKQKTTFNEDLSQNKSLSNPSSDLNTTLKSISDRVIASINSEANKLISEISSASYRSQPVNIADSGNIVPSISGYFSGLYSTISTEVGIRLDEIIRLLSTAGSVSTSQSPLDILGGIGAGENAKGGIIRRAFGGLAGFISGGAIKASGGFRDDSVPARLSNGEYVIQAPVVKSLGEKFFDFVNSTGVVPALAAGGALFTDRKRKDYEAPTIDTSKFNYTDGGASLLKLPDQIVESKPKAPKKISKFRKFLGGALSFIAPFLSFIPGIGPLLSLGAGAAGGALSGNNLKESIIGGIFGGLGNLGGFAGGDSKFGKFASFFSSGKGKALTGLLGSSTNNSGNQAGFAGSGLLSILQKLGIFNKKSRNGGIISLAGGGILDIFSGFGNKISSIFGKLGSNSGSSGSGNSGGLDKLLLLFGLSSALGSLTNKQPQQDFTEVTVDDPDAERKNRFGSAFNTLVENGNIPGFKYDPETLKKLLRQQEGLRNLVKNPKQNGFFKFISGILPFLGSLAGSFGKSSSLKGLVDSPLKFNNNPLGNFNAAFGGMVKKLAGGGSVIGAGTSTSDSIPALLSNGEYVIKASSVRMLGTNILDSINAGRFAFADGGVVAPGISSLPEAHPASSNNVNVDGRVTIVNQLDPQLFDEYMRSSNGQRTFINTISRNKRAVKQAQN